MAAITFELVRNDHARDIHELLEEFAEKLLGGFSVPLTLHEDIEHVAILIHRPPEIMPLTMNGEENFVQVPLVTRSEAPTTQLIRIGLSKLQTPFTNGFLARLYPFMPHRRGCRSSGSAVRRGFPPCPLSQVTCKNG